MTLHRLNRVEYNNSVRDLLGTALRPADDFPSDDRGYGFDNIASVLSLSPLQVELYLGAAEKLVDEALAVPLAQPLVSQFEAEDVKSSVGAVYQTTFWNLYSNGEVSTTLRLPLEGDYRISVRAFGMQAGPEPAKMAVLVDGATVKTFDVTAEVAAPAVYEVKVKLSAGPKTIAVAFLNDYYVAATKMDRNLVIDWFKIEGPLDLPPPESSARNRIMTCDPAVLGADPCARQIIGAFARRAYRRRVSGDELAALVALATQAAADPPAGPSANAFDGGIRQALVAILTSPHFLFRVEIDPQPGSTTPHGLSDHELASRLSYFLWSSTPDEPLLAAADAGKLRGAAELDAALDRMLADPKADALVDNFGGQWLYTRSLDDHVPDYATFPMFDKPLKDAMRAETQAFLREFLTSDVGAEKLLTADFTYVNDRLARHYGMPTDGSADVKRVMVAGTRRGLLMQGSVLTVTSYPTRTSPVARGKWVLEQLLCSGPPPPPPGVEGLLPQMKPTGSLRTRMEQHRQDPKCAGCHGLMDPIGFGLETFDGVGAERSQDQGFPIDTSGSLPGGQSFGNPTELTALLTEDPRFARCVVQKLYTYALGRGTGAADDVWLDGLARDFATKGHRLRDLLKLIAKSDAFVWRRGEPEGAP